MEEIICDPDAAATQEMFADDAPSAEVSFPIVVPTQWPVCPDLRESMYCAELGQKYFVMSTHGDGACGLHALWGQPLPSELQRTQLEL